MYRKLVVELRKKSQEETEKFHFIRDGTIVSRERDRGEGFECVYKVFANIIVK